MSVNDPPVNAVPGPQTTLINTALAFTDFRENRISTDDPDAGLNPVKVTLAAENGVITLIDPNPDDSLTYETGDGYRDITMTFVGRLSSIDQALHWVVFTPDAGFTGTGSLTITTDDQGYFGTGGPKSDTDIITIDVTEVPPFEAPPTWTTFPSALDTTFDNDGMMTLSLSDGIDYIHEIKLTSDGKYLAVGAINDHFGVMRFNADLSLDPTFGNGGTVEINIAEGYHAFTIKEDHQGRYLVGGHFSLVRLHTDGSLDSTFGNGGIADDPLPVFDINIQADGKILTVGDNHPDPTSGGNVQSYLQRRSADGTPEFDYPYGVGSG
ncbi:MAG: hypothetical protein MK108_17235, partial [Mariniblastus sp.]|nr:hypothetical protein [Mariniblastus sp.]